MRLKMSFFPLICLNKNNKLTKKAPKGFTLVELLIVVSIFSVVSLAIYSTFSSGASILRRIKNVDFRQQKLLLKTERFSRELREQPNYKKQLFQGSRYKINFAASLNYFPSRVTYYFDPSLFCLMRCEDKLDTIITAEGKIDPELKAKATVFLPKVKEVNFSYFYFDLGKKDYLWVEDWKADFLPLAVRMTVSTESQNYVSTIFLPTG